MYMKFSNCGMRFIDCIHVDASPLSRLPQTFGIEAMTGHFPNLFNRPDNYDYDGETPDEFYVGAQNVKSELYGCDEFKLSGKKLNFMKETKKYCRADVEVLSNTVLASRKMFKDMNYM